MNEVLTELSFNEWVRHIFDHPVTEPAWHWDENADHAELEPQRVVAYATELFQRAGELLAPYTDAQVNQGLWFLISESSSPLYALTEASIPLEQRVHCIRSISKLFEQCFVARCTPHLSHLDEPGAGALNSICYMWWDIFPLRGQPEDTARREIDEACLSVMEATLQLPSVACQESALHGLGHWGLYYKNQCQSIISAFLQRHRDLRPELQRYATRARERSVQ
ncbi:MAG: hypothetical protein ABSG80_10300 [Verrucomicrobiota bacterium]|jgi:hypothetical protein